jgi:hypothetical protein
LLTPEEANQVLVRLPKVMGLPAPNFIMPNAGRLINVL